MLKGIQSLLFLILVNSGFSQQNWQQVKNTFDVRLITGDRDGKTYIVSSDQIYTSVDQGANWDTLNFGNPEISDFFTLVIHPDSGFLYVAVEPGVYRSVDKGESWVKLDQRIIGTYSMGIDSSGRIFASGSQGVFRSEDNGLTWDSVFHVPGIFTNGILCTPENQVYVASIIGGLYLSEDGGITWDTIHEIASDTGQVTSLSYNAHTGTILAAYQHNSFFTGSEGRIYRSEDNGHTWNVIPLNSHVANAVYADENGTFFAGALSIYRSLDDGLTWQLFDKGLSGELQIQSFGKIRDVLFAGNAGFGLFRLTEYPASTTKNLEPGNPGIHTRIYPNPGRDIVNFLIDIPKNEFVTINIHNQAGQLLSKQIYENLEPGIHHFKWDTSDQPGGTYLYRVQAGRFIQSGKIIVSR